MSAITYQSFNTLFLEFVSELSQTFDEYPDLAKAHEALVSLLALDDTVPLPMKTFHETFEAYSSLIMTKDPALFDECVIPYTDSFQMKKEYGESDADTQDAIWNYLQQLFVTATTVQNMPASMMTNIESVAQACLAKVQSGEVSEEQAQNPLFIMQQLQQNPDLMKAMQTDDGGGLIK